MTSLLLLLLACGGASAPEGANPPAAPSATTAAAPAVRTAPAKAVKHRPSVELTGTLAATASVQLGFDVPGRIEKLMVKRGQQVKKGAAIARLDDSMASAQYAQAKAAVSGAKAQLAAGEAALGRLEKLKAAGGISEQQWDDAVAAVTAGRAGVEQAEAATRLAKTHLDNHVLKAPIAGLVSNGPDNAGMMVGAGMPLFLIEDVTTLQVKATAPETASWIAEGDEASLLLPGGETVAAQVVRVIPSLDMATRRVPVEIVVENPPSTLRANAFARVKVTGAAEVDAYEIPAAALVARPDFCVYVQEGEALRRVPAEVLSREAATAVIRAELPASAEVVLDPPKEAGE
jgi:RND family efflux transporter MFP subunit